MTDLRLSPELAERLATHPGKVHVTGGTGWFGRAALELLEHALGERFEARVRAYASATKEAWLRSGRAVVARPLAELPTTVGDDDLVLHFAFLIRDQALTVGNERYVFDNLAITTDVVAALAAARCAGLLYASSGAVHDGRGGRVSDLAGDPYGTLKHLDELTFTQACAETETRCVVARVFASSGPYMTRPQNYALGDLLLQGLAGGPLRIASARPVLRSYAAVGDIVAVGLAHLLGAGPGDPTIFDATGPEVEIGELAARIAAVLGSDLAVERPAADGTPANRYIGDPAAFEDLARRHRIDLSDLDQQIAVTAQWLRSGP